MVRGRRFRDEVVVGGRSWRLSKNSSSLEVYFRVKVREFRVRGFI